MTKLKLTLVAFLALASVPALACACDEDCKEGEIYSDEAEMCVADTA
ncbi:MAG: hypothetical protein AAGH68_10360 [Pseudomonadota bacterium]